MTEIDALQRRINAALSRAAAGLDALGPQRADAGEALQAALDEERAANAQLEERLSMVTERNAADQARLQQAHQDVVARVDALDLELQRLRQANVKLREANARLREANAEGVGDPDLINAGLQAELDAMRAARDADVAEASAILAALAPVLRDGEGEGDHA